MFGILRFLPEPMLLEDERLRYTRANAHANAGGRADAPTPARRTHRIPTPPSLPSFLPNTLSNRCCIQKTFNLTPLPPLQLHPRLHLLRLQTHNTTHLLHKSPKYPFSRRGVVLWYGGEGTLEVGGGGVEEFLDAEGAGVR